MADLLDIRGRVALVTGAGQGVGRQVAHYLAEHGAGGVIVKAVGRYGITVNSVALAAIETPTTAPLMEDEAARKTMLRNYIIRRVGRPEDPAGMVLFLCSDAAEWISGQTYPVNGGYRTRTGPSRIRGRQESSQADR